MNKILDQLYGDQELSLTCENCGKEFNVKFRQICKDGNEVQCPKCHSSIKVVHNAQTKKTLKDAEKATKEFEKMFK